MAKIIEITATVVEEKRPPNCENFVILRCRPNEERDREVFGQYFTAVGSAQPDELKLHLSYRFFGHFVENERFGSQFKLSTFTPARPHGQTGVVKYLQQCPHIGEATARQLWNLFQSDTVRICREHPEVVTAKVPRLTKEKMQDVSDALTDMADLENTSIDLIELLNGRGFPRDTARNAMRVWGARAPEVIRRDPYKLMRFRGCGFLKCDSMYLDQGLPPARMKRQVVCSWHAVASDPEGHVWMPERTCRDGLTAKIAGVELDPEKALAIACRLKALVTRRDCQACQGTGVGLVPDLFLGERLVSGPCPACRGTGGGRWIAEERKAANERYCVERIAEMMGWESHWPTIEGPAFDRLTPHQREQLTIATSGPVGLFCGAPGAGKTFSLAALVKLLIQRHRQLSVAIACPTGKAAQRARETMVGYGLDVQATTIHRLLRVTHSGDDGWSFEHDETNPLPIQYLILDETSMLSDSLFASVLAALGRGTNLLMVGDVNQLLPVDYGAPLRDLIAHLPYGELREIHRNSGTIVRACAAIRDNAPIPLDERIELEPTCPGCCGDAIETMPLYDTGSCPHCDRTGKLPPRNLQLVPATKQNAQAELLRLIERLKRQPGLDPIWDLQVCVAVNEKSDLSRKTLGPLLQQALNPHGKGVQGSPFRVGDKLMCTKNSFLKLHRNSEEKVLVANGEFGKVLEVEPTRTVIEFRNPTRIVMVPRGRQEGDAQDHDRTGCDLVLGYAATVHKMQGSSAPIVIGVLDEYPGATGQHGVCDRAWLFTLISRAEQACYLVGRRSTMTDMCRRQYIKKRKTFMSEMLAAKLASAPAQSPELQEVP